MRYSRYFKDAIFFALFLLKAYFSSFIFSNKLNYLKISLLNSLSSFQNIKPNLSFHFSTKFNIAKEFSILFIKNY